MIRRGPRAAKEEDYAGRIAEYPPHALRLDGRVQRFRREHRRDQAAHDEQRHPTRRQPIPRVARAPDVCDVARHQHRKQRAEDRRRVQRLFCSSSRARRRQKKGAKEHTLNAADRTAPVT